MRTEMKKLFVAGAFVGSALLIQGGGTTMAPVELPSEPRPMPPPAGVKPRKPLCPPPGAPGSVPQVTVVKVVPPPVVKPAVVKTTDYVISKGDTLSGIAHRYGVSYADIMDLNKITNPNKIFVGQKIVLPGKVDVSKPVKRSQASGRTSRPIPAGSQVYVVKKGDCLSKIASRAGVKTTSLMDANGLTNKDMIKVGQKLVIPAGHKVASSGSSSRSVKSARVSTGAQTTSEPPDVTAPDAGIGDFPLPDIPDVAPSPIEPVSTGSQSYVVKDGDNILSVASEFNISIADLREANNLSSDVLSPGQRLVIPTRD